jgi:hypothetical protein
VSPALQAIAAVAVMALVVLAAFLALRRFTPRLPGGEVVVRCKQGHLFTTVWIPGVSVKAVRLGWVRFQYCPVGEHWTFVTPVRWTDLTEEQRRFAARHRDSRLP